MFEKLFLAKEEIKLTFILLWLIVPWLDIFPNRYLLFGFHKLIALMNQYLPYFPDG
ncbi:MAG: hypothetical protein ACRC2S_12475 [Waterburya sp.]